MMADAFMQVHSFLQTCRYITKDELSRIVKAVYDLMGRAVEPLVEEHTTREHVERVFNRLDLNKDGVVTIDEFMDSCTKVDTKDALSFLIYLIWYFIY